MHSAQWGICKHKNKKKALDSRVNKQTLLEDVYGSHSTDLNFFSSMEIPIKRTSLASYK